MKNNKPVLIDGFGEINYGKQFRLGNRIYDSNAVAMAHCANPVGNLGGYTYLYLIKEDVMGETRYRIRKLTPAECGILMGFTKDDDNKMAGIGISNSQRYKCYGNGIITNCVELLFEHLYKSQYDPRFECYDENFPQPSLT